MSGGKAAYYQAKMLDHGLGKTLWVPPDSLWVVLSVAGFNPDATGAACDEVPAAGTSYVRFELTNDVATFPAAAGSDPASKSIAVDVAFATATADYGTVYSAYLADALVDGNLVYGSDAVAPVPIANGSTLVIPAGTWVFSEL
jgi:hypothetical protein